MAKNKIILMAALFLLSGLEAASQAGKPPASASAEPPVPGRMQLLDGFHHQFRSTKDSQAGRIWKENGLIIDYDLGAFSGDHASGVARRDVAWAQRQTVGGRALLVVKTIDARVVATFAANPADLKNPLGPYPANFSARISGDGELAEFLLMVTTYAPSASAAAVK